MSEPETQTDHPYTGPAMGDPRAKKIGTFSGRLSQQSPQFQAAVASLRAQLRSHEEGYSPMPYTVELVMADGTQIQSQPNPCTDGTNPTTGDCRLILSRWNRNQLEWVIVDIKGDVVTLSVHQNPPDPQQNWRKLAPTIIPPTPA